MVVRRIKKKRRGGLKLAVFSYRKPNPQPLISSYQSLVPSHYFPSIDPERNPSRSMVT